MLSAYLVCDVHEFLTRPVLFGSPAVFVRFKSPAVDAIRIVENAMEMRMVLVYVAGQEILIFAFKELLAYLLTELQGSLRRDLTGLETHNEVLGEDCASARSVRPYFFKVMVSLFGIGAASLCEDQSTVCQITPHRSSYPQEQVRE